MGNPNCKGAGINMALSAGAQMGKAFSLSSNEYGGANFAAMPTFSFRPGTGSNEALRFILLGLILVDSMGDCFVSEQVANKEAMHCAEPFIRAKTYYTVVDQDFVDYVSVTPLGGIKCDTKCRVLDPDNRPIDRLFIAGGDADIYCAPYIAGGSANGFAQASGLIAGESAA